MFGGSAIVLTKPGVRVRSHWRTRHDAHVGSPVQMGVGLGTWLLYSTFWVATLALKLAFGWFALIEPLAPALAALWSVPFPQLSTGAGCENSGFGCAFDRTVRAILIVIRSSVRIGTRLGRGASHTHAQPP